LEKYGTGPKIKINEKIIFTGQAAIITVIKTAFCKEIDQYIYIKKKIKPWTG